MPLPPALQQAVIDRVEHCYQRAEAHWSRPFPRPRVEFRLRGQSAGVAHLQENRLRFNPVLLRDNPDAFIEEVVPHEVAHLLVWQCHGKVAPHGREWQSVMRELFQLTPRTRHQFDVSQLAPPSFAYRCSCQSHQLTLRRHNKVQRQQVQYLCRHCGEALVPSQDAEG
ncbi:SprT family zinc-dependent metalloprotease [Ferrimonas marina]|uniref:Protein SprT n=1 Tax=Ferrimonas marina TaxID=299255 RepID=A0A1M5VW01_9GAMM|nr:SprT family zinc-dependent metalloprotease [Ferrimonas marina]SHH79123.1 SprT protein [Ferrimonas marina]